MRKFIVSILSIAALGACTPDASSPQEGVVISAPMVRQPMGGQTTTAGYFKITNHTDKDDVLMGVTSSDAGRVEMHLTEDNNGIMSMKRKESVDLPVGKSLSFEPGGYHLMLFNIDLAKDQKDVQLTLKFKHAPDLPIIAELVETTPLPDHSGH